jgi:hypothetical protein
MNASANSVRVREKPVFSGKWDIGLSYDRKTRELEVEVNASRFFRVLENREIICGGLIAKLNEMLAVELKKNADLEEKQDEKLG